MVIASSQQIKNTTKLENVKRRGKYKYESDASEESFRVRIERSIMRSVGYKIDKRQKKTRNQGKYSYMLVIITRVYIHFNISLLKRLISFYKHICRLFMHSFVYSVYVKLFDFDPPISPQYAEAKTI